MGSRGALESVVALEGRGQAHRFDLDILACLRLLRTGRASGEVTFGLLFVVPLVFRSEFCRLRILRPTVLR